MRKFDDLTRDRPIAFRPAINMVVSRVELPCHRVFLILFQLNAAEKGKESLHRIPTLSTIGRDQRHKPNVWPKSLLH